MTCDLVAEFEVLGDVLVADTQGVASVSDFIDLAIIGFTQREGVLEFTGEHSVVEDQALRQCSRLIPLNGACRANLLPVLISFS